MINLPVVSEKVIGIYCWIQKVSHRIYMSRYILVHVYVCIIPIIYVLRLVGMCFHNILSCIICIGV